MRFITVGIVVLALLLGSQLPGTPDRPARAHKLTVKEMCRGPNRPDWCRELYADLAHGREVREKQATKGSKAEETGVYDEIEQSHMEDLK